ARPCADASLISCCDLRCSVILRGAPASSCRPCERRRCVSSSILASSLMMSSAPPTWIPASPSCTSSRSTGTFRTSANCVTGTSAMYSILRSRLLALFEPVLARREDQLARTLFVEVRDVDQVVDRLLGQVFTRDDAVPRQLGGRDAVHA